MTNWNEEGRTTNVKLRNSSGFILAAIKIAERSDILNSSILIFIRQSTLPCCKTTIDKQLSSGHIGGCL